MSESMIVAEDAKSSDLLYLRDRNFLQIPLRKISDTLTTPYTLPPAPFLKFFCKSPYKRPSKPIDCTPLQSSTVPSSIDHCTLFNRLSSGSFIRIVDPRNNPCVNMTAGMILPLDHLNVIPERGT